MLENLENYSGSRPAILDINESNERITSLAKTKTDHCWVHCKDLTGGKELLARKIDKEKILHNEMGSYDVTEVDKNKRLKLFKEKPINDFDLIRLNGRHHTIWLPKEETRPEYLDRIATE